MNKIQLRANSGRMLEFVAKYSIYFITLVFIIVCTFLSPRFLTTSNMLNVLRQISIFALVAFAESLLIISGNLDLAIGATMVLSGCVSITAYLATGSMLAAVIAAILTAMLCNFVISGFVVLFKIPPFIVTLGAQMAYRGVVYLYTDGVIMTKTGMNFRVLGQGYVGPIPVPIIIMLAAAFFLYVILDKTRLGRNFYAMGGNREAARASGINLTKHTIYAYIIAGVFTGLAGIVFTSRVNAGLPNGAIGFEGQGIAAAVIGGIGFAGGSGSAWGVIIGALVMGIFSNILNLLGVNSYVQDIITGLIIVIAVALDTWTRSRRVSR